MTKISPSLMDRDAASRIVRTETKANGGQQPAGGFGTRADRTVQQREAAAAKPAPRDVKSGASPQRHGVAAHAAQERSQPRPSHTPMDREAASRIVRAETKANVGRQPGGEFGGRADRTVQQREALAGQPPKKENPRLCPAAPAVARPQAGQQDRRQPPTHGAGSRGRQPVPNVAVPSVKQSLSTSPGQRLTHSTGAQQVTQKREEPRKPESRQQHVGKHTVRKYG